MKALIIQPRSDRGVHSITRYSLPNFGDGHDRLPEGAVVMHVDVDAFYAQVEQEDYNLRGIPVIVGAWQGDHGSARGIVATASYEARQFGIQTGMTHFEALQRCPYLVALRIHYEKYREISRCIHQCLQQHCPEVERYSMDEFFARIPSHAAGSALQAHAFARQIRKTLEHSFALTVSIGVATNKSYAKLGSNLNKPGGITLLLESNEIISRVHPLPLNRICGIGNKRAAKLGQLGVHSIGDAFERGKGPFQSLFGPHLGQLMWEAATGNEVSPLLEQEMTPKEFHHLHTLSRPTRDLEQLKGELMRSIFEVCQRMRRYRVATRKWELYLRFACSQWQGVSVPVKLREDSCCDTEVFAACWRHLGPMAERFLDQQQRFLGIGITALEPSRQHQLLFHLDTQPDPVNWFHAMDHCNARAGDSVVMPATAFQASRERVHFLEI